MLIKFFLVTESPVLWLYKMIEDKIKPIECDSDEEKKISASEKDLDDKSSSNLQDLKWLYLTRSLRVLGSLKEMLIHAGVPMIDSGMNISQKGFGQRYRWNIIMKNGMI